MRPLRGAARLAALSAILETEGEGDVMIETVVLDAGMLAEGTSDAVPELVVWTAAVVEFLPPNTLELLMMMLLLEAADVVEGASVVEGAAAVELAAVDVTLGVWDTRPPVTL